MAWHSDSFVGLSYTGDSYLSITDVTLGTGGYVAESYTAKGYTGEFYNGFPGGEPVSFIASGEGAAVDCQGFSGGFQFSKQGTEASVGVTTGWPGFVPDAGGILDNDADPDGDPLSYTVVTQPEAGTLSAYVGGAFEWDPGAAPPGRYSWTYRLFAGGEQSDDLGVVTIEYGNLFASVGVQGFASDFGFGFEEQGSAASVLITGFAGEMLLTVADAGTAADADCEGFAGSVTVGFIGRGTRAEVAPQGNDGLLVGTFVDQGTAASVECEGFAGTLQVGTFFNAQGTAAEVAPEGNSGTLDTGGFSRQGTGAEVIPIGVAGNMRLGFTKQGSAAGVNVQGFSPQVVSIVGARANVRARGRKATVRSVGLKASVR